MAYNLGRIGLLIKGEYNSNTTYENLDVVSYDGSSYVAKGSCKNVIPTTKTSWMLLASGLTDSISSTDELYRFGIQVGMTDTVSVTKNSVTSFTITFPKPYLAGTVPACFPIFFTGSTAAAMADVSIACFTTVNTNFSARCYNNSATTRSPKIRWMSIGIPDPNLVS